MKTILLTILLFLWTLHPKFINNLNNEISIYDLPFNHFIGTEMERKLHRSTNLANIESMERMGMKGIQFIEAMKYKTKGQLCFQDIK